MTFDEYIRGLFIYKNIGYLQVKMRAFGSI